MHKLFPTLVCVTILVTGAIFHSCDKNDNQKETEHPNQLTGAQLIGKWQSYKSFYKDEWHEDEGDTVWTFNADGTGTWVDKGNDPEPISYQLNNSILHISTQMESAATIYYYQIITLNGEELVTSHTHPSITNLTIIDYLKKIQ